VSLAASSPWRVTGRVPDKDVYDAYFTSGGSDR
jgi:hypothetical protein